MVDNVLSLLEEADECLADAERKAEMGTSMMIRDLRGELDNLIQRSERIDDDNIKTSDR